MGKWALFSHPPLALIAGAALILLGIQIPRWLGGKDRDALPKDQGKSTYIQMFIYAAVVILFLLDFFLILRRDGFRASWSLTFWMMLAAFMVGEMVGRWNANRGSAESRETLDP